MTITHEVWDENTNCPPSLHGVAPVTVGVTDDDVPGITVSPPRLTVPEGNMPHLYGETEHPTDGVNGDRLGIGCRPGRT